MEKGRKMGDIGITGDEMEVFIDLWEQPSSFFAFPTWYDGISSDPVAMGGVVSCYSR